MFWYILASITFAAAVGLLIYARIRDRRYLKMKTSESMSRELWEEIEEEHKASLDRKQKFEEALKKAKHEAGGRKHEISPPS